MDNLRKFGYICLVCVIAAELGVGIYNLLSGKSLFYLFDLSNRFSVDNNLFILYWGSLVGLIFFVREFDKLNNFQKLFDLDNENKSQTDTIPKETRQRNDIPSENDQRFRQFLREQNLSYLQCSHKWESYWKQKYRNWSPQSNARYMTHNLKYFLREKKISHLFDNQMK